MEKISNPQQKTTDMMIICQLYSLVMGKGHVLNKFVLQIVIVV